MEKKSTNYLRLLAIVFLYLGCGLLPADAIAQGMHFSQYYNAPMLLNPANTGLMSDQDYRAGVNFRNQWASLPVPYKTFSAYADFQLFRKRNLTNTWLGAGFAFYNDKAGNGDLALTRTEAFLAYHIEIGTTSMLSGGLSGAYVQRSVDFSKLTFNDQWDGMLFNTTMASNEQPGAVKTNYLDVSAGLNYALYPNENIYIKLGAGVSHINQPKESFYGMINQMGIRPTGNLDALFKLSDGLTINPSVYYTNERIASELIYGTLFSIYVAGDARDGQQVILGAYHRYGDAIIATAGLDWAGFRTMISYDITTSKLSPYNGSNGAFELGVRWQGRYSGQNGMDRRMMACPRF